MTKVRIELQKVSKQKFHRPHKREVNAWFEVLLQSLEECGKPIMENYELTLRIVDDEESLKLNHKFRGINKSTNVLSFPFESPVEETNPYLGDIVICGAVVALEASEQHVDIKAYWAKLFVHGCLHLMGYNHTADEEAEIMQKLEDDVAARMMAA